MRYRLGDKMGVIIKGAEVISNNGNHHRLLHKKPMGFYKSVHEFCSLVTNKTSQILKNNK
ncbi:MAG: hypothetical protein Q8K30_02220 [Candidatus Gracilibacteria bacterium]|nr:hypothetical protein [Candidatus Gracilibacteria bacterium]